ncbi:Septum formation protein Maf [uncultured Candidatus Thioglobus sp.]|nr:Septum formation protein Maf [uncultured Candidatus Thioglobus sp.]
MKINLASNSLRRQKLLQQIGVDFDVIDISINEVWDRQELAKDYVMRMALEKAYAAKLKVHNKAPILAADTSVILDDIVLGKAETAQDAKKMLQQLSGRAHQVYTAVALLGADELFRLQISQVHFRCLSETEIMQYCDTQEPLGKAGGYAIQGQGAIFIKHLAGSYSGVMGLPLFEIAEMLQQLVDHQGSVE